MFPRIKDNNINNIPIDGDMRKELEYILGILKISSELYKSIKYVLEKGNLGSVLVADEFTRGIATKVNSNIHELFLSGFKTHFITSLTDNGAYKRLGPDVNSLEECWDEGNRILKTLWSNRRIIAYDNDLYYYDFFKKETLFGVNIELHPNTMAPKLTTGALINQVFKYLKQKESSNYQIIDIGTGETNFIPKVIKHYSPSLEVLGFDVEMMFDDLGKKVGGNFGSRDTIQPYINKEKSLIITANLPYSPGEDIQNFDPLVQQESKSVGHRSFKGGGKDGLDLYRMYIDDMSSDESNLPNVRFIVFEALEKNIQILESYVKEKLPGTRTSLHKNYKDENRILRIEL